MKPATVKKAAVTVNIAKGKGSPAKKKLASAAFPDADALARKYDVEESEGASKELGAGLSLQQQMEFMKKQQTLVQKLESKNVELDQLCTLLEAVEPIPGMNPEKYRRIIENPDADTVDFRDSKIVELAKKSRKLQMLLTKERTLNENHQGSIIELKQTIEKMRRELESTIPNQNDAANRVIRGQDTNTMREFSQKDDGDLVSVPQLQKEISDKNRKMEEIRRKFHQLEDENKNISRALVREVGDGVSLEQAVDEGRKGRAQQIIMLKSKIKRLEMAASSSGSVTMATNMTARTSRTNVDSQAEEELEYMSSVRKLAVDELSEAHQKLSDQFTGLESKHHGAKARIRTMEAEAQQHRQQIKIVIDKTENDDKLIQVLKDEIQRLKDASVRQSMERRGDDVEIKIQKASKAAAAVATKHADSELTRLRRLTKQQSEQLATQDGIIRELRATNRKY